MMHQIMLQFLADIKCTNKTVRRQYILNKVFEIIQIRYHTSTYIWIVQKWGFRGKRDFDIEIEGIWLS